MKKEKDRKMGISYEVKMYQLLILFVVSIFVAIGIGAWLGHSIGYSAGVSAVSVETPEYCHASNSGHENVQVKCNELQNITLAEVCNQLSTPLAQKVRILITN